MRPRSILASALSLILVAGAAAAQPARKLEPFETGEGISLPTGRLQLLSGREGAAFFLDLDRIERSGDTVTYWTFGAYVPGYPIGGRTVVQETALQTIDCGDRTIRTLGVSSFDDAGRFVVGLPAMEVEPIADSSAHDFQARVLCDVAVAPASNIFPGHAAALAAARLNLGPKGRPA